MLPKITNLFSPIFGRSKKTADNRLATLADLNEMIAQLSKNSIFGAETYVMLVTQNPGVPTLVTSVVQCTCVSNTAGGCPTCLNPCGYSCKSTVSSFAQTDTGTYRLVLNLDDYPNYIDTFVTVGNLEEVGYIANVVKVNASTYDIKVIDTVSGGVPTSYKLKNTPVTINIQGGARGGYYYVN